MLAVSPSGVLVNHSLGITVGSISQVSLLTQRTMDSSLTAGFIWAWDGRMDGCGRDQLLMADCFGLEGLRRLSERVRFIFAAAGLVR